MKYSEGDEVMAIPPNSDDYQKGIIIGIRGSKYRIQFEGGAESERGESEIQQGRSSRSSARTRSRGRKSPSRKSPSRQSPGRKPSTRRSPARSPKRRVGRQRRVQDPEEIEKESRNSDSKETADQLNELISFSSSQIKEAPMATRRSTRISMMRGDKISSSRSFDRAVSLPVERKITYEYVAENKERGYSIHKDQDLQKLLHYEEEALPDSSTTVEKLTKKKEIDLVAKPQEWGGWFGALCLTIILPVAIILPQAACRSAKCSTTDFRLPVKWQYYFNVNATLYYLGFLLFIATASLLPIGKIVVGQHSKIGRLEYRTNSWLVTLISVAAFGFCQYRYYNIADYVLRSVFHLSLGGWLIGTVLAILLYIKAGKAPVAALNIYGSTNNVIYDFWQGREVNPRIGKLDVKIVLMRASVIGTIILNLAIITQSLKGVTTSSLGNINFTVLVAAGLQILYSLDAVIFEHASFTSFKVMYEGTGYMVCVANLLHPFFLTLMPRYVLYQNLRKPAYVLALLTLCFFIGYLIYRISNSLKDNFRRNPYAPIYANMETIVTPRGNKLITSGLWGQVRHPNYLGDIIMNWSIAGIALFTHEMIPYYPVLSLTLVLMHRAYRDHVRCKTRYGSAWKQYCLQVRSMIFKRIY